MVGRPSWSLTYMGVGEHFFHDKVVVDLLCQFPPLLQAFRLLEVFNLQCKSTHIPEGQVYLLRTAGSPLLLLLRLLFMTLDSVSGPRRGAT